MVLVARRLGTVRERGGDLLRLTMLAADQHGVGRDRTCHAFPQATGLLQGCAVFQRLLAMPVSGSVHRRKVHHHQGPLVVIEVPPKSWRVG